MTDETKAVLEELAAKCDQEANSAEKGREFYENLGKFETGARFDGEHNAWIQAAAMLRAKAMS